MTCDCPLKTEQKNKEITAQITAHVDKNKQKRSGSKCHFCTVLGIVKSTEDVTLPKKKLNIF